MGWVSTLERDKLPPVGSWAMVIQDWNLGDWFDRQHKPLRVVHAARLRDVDSEGWCTWEQWSANGYGIGLLYLVSHWMPYPTTDGAVFEVANYEKDEADL